MAMTQYTEAPKSRFSINLYKCTNLKVVWPVKYKKLVKNRQKGFFRRKHYFDFANYVTSAFSFHS